MKSRRHLTIDDATYGKAQKTADSLGISVSAYISMLINKADMKGKE